MDGFTLPTIPPHTLQPGVKHEDVKAEELVAEWLSKLSDRLRGDSVGELTDLFLDNCWWRDIVGLDWDLTSKQGLERVHQYLQSAPNRLANVQPISTGGLKPVLIDLGGMIWIQGGFTFTNGHGSGRGLVKLLNVGGAAEWKAWIVLTQLEQLDFQKNLDAKRALNPAAAAAAASSQANGDVPHSGSEDDLQVLIVGAGQAGLSLSARLSDMGIRTLLVDRHARLGDAWRARYKTVTLNTPTYTDHPPFMKLPSNWPRWLQRDQVADFLEHYGQMMGLECLLNADVTSTEYDESARRYTVNIQRGDWKMTLKPRHVVLATGTFGNQPVIPTFPGQETFKGQVYHSSKHTFAGDVANVSDKKVVVIGPGTSGHDIAQDFVTQGAKEVSIIQRHPIFYFSAEASETIQLALWNMDGVSTEEADLVGNAIPLAVIRAMGAGMSQGMAQIDKEKIEGLKAAGLALRTGEDGYGLPDYQLIKGGHFYMDQGAGQMIVDGRIKIHRCEEGVRDFQAEGLNLADGTHVPADIIVLATGYHSSLQNVERLMGEKIAGKMSKHFGVLDEENERAGWWRATGQPGFWYFTGSFMWCRQYSLALALQIAAVEKGLNEKHWESKLKG